VEDVRVKTHTANPAFFAAWGRWPRTKEPERLTDLVPKIRELLGLSEDGPGTAPATAG
jgi:hypothetical protein